MSHKRFLNNKMTGNAAITFWGKQCSFVFAQDWDSEFYNVSK